MLRPLLAVLLLAATATPVAAAQPARPDNPQIDYAGFRRLAGEVEPYRQTRLVNWAEFDRLRRQREVLILDARSESAFRRGHIRGAVNLPFTDFTAQSLARAIGPRRDRPILIYCNNNFSNNRAPVMLKSVQLALNIQTFINLVGYGYRNVRELNDVIDFNDPAVRWVRG
jgi:rhodanese-related sulfurtransferase